MFLLQAIKPMLPVFGIALAGWLLIRLCCWLYRVNKRMVQK